jgi:cytidylate kinase
VIPFIEERKQRPSERKATSMAIITIYQGASGSGEELAVAVAQALGYGCVSREVLVRTSLCYGIPEAKLNEIVEKGPSWWERFAQTLQPYRLAMQAAFCEILETEGYPGLVYHGHIGHELLPSFNHVLKVLLTAPMEMRIQQVRERQELSEVAARRYVEEVDKARSRRLMALFGADWRDASRFDLVVNLGRMSTQGATRLITEAVHLPDYQMTPASKQAFEDFALGTRVHAGLVMSKDPSQSSFDIKARDGAVAVKGTIPSWLSEDTVVAKIKEIPGVKTVKAEIANAPDLFIGD